MKDNLLQKQNYGTVGNFGVEGNLFFFFLEYVEANILLLWTMVGNL